MQEIYNIFETRLDSQKIKGETPNHEDYFYIPRRKFFIYVSLSKYLNNFERIWLYSLIIQSQATWKKDLI